MPKTSARTKQYQENWTWQHLQGLVTQEILDAPQLDWGQVESRNIRYLVRTITQVPWVTPCAFLAVVLTTYAGLDAQTVLHYLKVLNARWRHLFPAYGLTAFSEWQPLEHIPRYMNDATGRDTFHTRQEFLHIYATVAEHTQAYLRSLLPAEQVLCRSWALPPLPMEIQRRFSRRAEVIEGQHQRRKIETDAVTPHFAQIRSEAHLRWNELHRLYLQYQEALTLVQSGMEALPLAFSYEEPRRNQRLHCVLWDRASFVLAHADQYHPSSVQKAQEKIERFHPSRNHYFLEYVKAEPLSERGPASGEFLWFDDLLRLGLLGNGPGCGSEEEVKQKQAYLRSWGYSHSEEQSISMPFRTGIAGLITWPREQTKTFMIFAQARAKGWLVPVEPLFAAATFGLASLDLFTSTGARMNELLQVSLTPECLHTLIVGGTRRLVLRLVPKGSDQPADYFVGPETQRNFEKVTQLLQKHYQLGGGEPIPRVPFNPNHPRAHRFPTRPYLFQFSGQHLLEGAVTACLRFLCHGMVFQTLDGQSVTLKAHILRHVFASHIHQVEQVPLDVVAMMMHQKDLEVTGYYAAPTRQQVIAAADVLLDRFATHLGSLEELLVRAPKELQQQLEEARQQVGTLATVVGGVCTCHAICPISFACTGCAFKIPDPARRDEIVEQQQWAYVRLEQVKKRGLGPETVKMQALAQRCTAELEEMRLIEEYRHDESYQPTLTLEAREQRAEETTPMVREALSGETPTNGAPGQSQRRSARSTATTSDH